MSLLHDLYFLTKPIIPRSVQIRLRQIVARRQLPLVSAVWPILESAGHQPKGWKGWPNDKKFGFVITHDVDTFCGLGRCHQLMELEERFGLRSAFYFVPEGRYSVSREFREEVEHRGFEVGVHGLRHDHRTFTSLVKFRSRVPKINRYLKEWNASGFRSPLMMQNLDWIKDLNIEYDASTFDTDPFEPQPYGVNTVFPFLVVDGTASHGYVEIPYTIPQDFTIFVLLKQRSIDIWKNKLAWLVSKGGLALLDVHPDYMVFPGARQSSGEFSSSLYEEFLGHLKTWYSGVFWHGLPRDVARYVRNGMR